MGEKEWKKESPASHIDWLPRTATVMLIAAMNRYVDTAGNFFNVNGEKYPRSQLLIAFDCN